MAQAARSRTRSGPVRRSRGMERWRSPERLQRNWRPIAGRACCGCRSRSRSAPCVAHGSGSSRLSPRNAHVAEALGNARLATLLFDLLTGAEAANRALVFDIALLAERLEAATAWAAESPLTRDLPLGYSAPARGRPPHSSRPGRNRARWTRSSSWRANGFSTISGRNRNTPCPEADSLEPERKTQW